MNNQYKAKKLFSFLKEFSACKRKIPCDIKSNEKNILINEISRYKNYIKFQMDYTSKDGEKDPFIKNGYVFQVFQPELSKCPYKPAKELEYILDFDYRNFKAKPSHKKLLVNNEDETLVAKYDSYIKQWTEWANEQKTISKVRDFFDELYKISQELENGSEGLELLAGNAFIKCINRDVYYPILLQRVSLKYDASSKSMIVENKGTPMINVLLLNEIDNNSYSSKQMIDSIGLQQLIDFETENEIHPFDKERINEFLKYAADTLNHKSLILDEEEKFDVQDFKYRDVELYIINKPIIFIRKRLTGIIQTIDTIIKNIDKEEEIPSSIMRLIGGIETIELEENIDKPFEQELAECGGEDKEIILPLPANKEQLKIARKITNSESVLVQGPPGTGKTHTIANLICNFLAEGKSVLVTSSTKKALGVLKEKVPDDLQNLCISLLDDDKTDMENSIRGISEFSSTNKAIDIKSEKEKIRVKRDGIIDNLYDTRQALYQMRSKEIKPVSYRGEEIHPIEIAKEIQMNKEKYEGIIKGKVQRQDELPLNYQELTELYNLNSKIRPEEEIEYDLGIPEIGEIPSVDLVRNLIEKENDLELESYNENIETISFNNVTINKENLQTEYFEELYSYLIEVMDIKNSWKEKVISSIGSNKQHKDILMVLIKSIADASETENQFYSEFLLHPISVSSEELEDVENNLKEAIKSNSSFSIMKIFSSKEHINYLKNNVTIDGKSMNAESNEQCELLKNYLEFAKKVKAVEKLWDSLLAKDVMRFKDLAVENPLEIARTYAKDIEKCIAWYDHDYNIILEIMEKSGIDYQGYMKEMPYLNSNEKFERTIDYLSNDVRKFLECFEIKQDFLELEEMIGEFSRKSRMIKQLEESLTRRQIEEYENTYNQIEALKDSSKHITRRNELLNKLGDVAPGWKFSIINREGIHGLCEVPENIEEIWRFKQFECILECSENDLVNTITKRNIELGIEYRKTTESYASLSAWYNLLKKLETNLELKGNLKEWSQTMKMIGKGNGKNSERYRKHAREKLADCQSAIPVWIMTVDQVYDNLTPGKNHFDVIIVDEASQCDITALSVVSYAEKVVIVGDDKQVSPSSVGIKIETVNSMIETHLKGIIPHYYQYTTNKSLYDLASLTFDDVMLLEHFRCVPDIIGFSNMLSYENKIKPLRSSESSNIKPAIVPVYLENGHRSENEKTNEAEADMAAALIDTMIKMPEYEDKTIGVITMLGSKQADFIFDKVCMKSGISIIDKHKIAFGNSAKFQGDEKDIIIVSLVDSNKRDEKGNIIPMRLVDNESMKQRYNVAISRAKDQIFILHSMDKDLGLKAKDIRKRLLNYAYDPNKFTNDETIEKNSDSPFETEVCKYLRNKGYDFEQQYEVGSYRIDIVVNGEEKQIAIECDGEAYHSGPEKIREDMERQTILERIGWTFIRIRGSEYYRNPELAMERVENQLNTYGIEPFSKKKAEGEDTAIVNTKLLKEAKKVFYNDYTKNANSDKKEIVENYLADY